MNKKGFTLIELLVVIALLGILAGFVTVNVLKVYERQKGKISRQEQKVIRQGVENIITMLEDCEDEFDGDLVSSLGYNSCTEARNAINSSNGADILLENIMATGYINGANLNEYDESSIINVRKNNGRYVVDVDKVIKKESDSMYLRTAILNNSNLLSTNDNYGVTRYFSGNVNNNYVDFAGMCWKIVRIQGDYSIKLILYNQLGLCENTDTNEIKSKNYTVSQGGTYYNNYSEKLNNVFAIKFSNVESKLKENDWCVSEIKLSDNDCGKLIRNDENLVKSLICKKELEFNNHFTSIINTPNLNNDFINNTRFVGSLTVFEMRLAGISSQTQNSNYLAYSTTTNDYYISFTTCDTYNNGTYVYIFNALGSLRPITINLSSSSFKLIPVIILKPGTLISGGDGTIANPYVVK